MKTRYFKIRDAYYYKNADCGVNEFWLDYLIGKGDIIKSKCFIHGSCTKTEITEEEYLIGTIE